MLSALSFYSTVLQNHRVGAVRRWYLSQSPCRHSD